MSNKRRLITFRMLKRCCTFQSPYGCLHEKSSLPFDLKKCAAKTCPVFNTLPIPKERA